MKLIGKKSPPIVRPLLRRGISVALVLIAVVALAPAAGAAPQNARGKARGTKAVPGSYIVVYRGSVQSAAGKTDRLERSKGFRSRLRYGRAVKGFAARLSQRQVSELRADPEVAFVAPDRPVKALGAVPLASGDTAPSGVQRIEAASATMAREASSAKVAVIDTGIDLGHPDLVNAEHGKNCVGSGPAQDDEGHGTHVAGTIAAENNGSGVVGVAPGTRTYAVKVLNAAGSGTDSQVICGIDWVTSTRTDSDPANDIAVANLSLGGVGVPVRPCSTTTDPLHKAICSSTSAGVTYVVAAGNDGWDFDYAASPDTPAAYPQVLTVSAMSDSDGKGGATGGAPACRAGEADDRYASFSNFAATSAGSAHTVAGPGVCINSTLRGGGQTLMSGTSMATPHLAGGVALCLGEGGKSGPCAGLSPAAIVNKVRSDAQARTTSVPSYGFVGDPARPITGKYFGYLWWAGGVGPPDTTAPETTIGSGPSGQTSDPTPAFEFSSDEPGSSFECRVDSEAFADCDSPKTTAQLSDGQHTFEVRATDLANNTDLSSATRTFTVAPTVYESTDYARYGTVFSDRGAVSRLFSDDGERVEITAARSGAYYLSMIAPYTVIAEERSSLEKLTIDYDGHATGADTGLVTAVYNFSRQKWELLENARLGVTSDRAVRWSNSSSPANYVSPEGAVIALVLGVSNQSIRTHTDLLEFSVHADSGTSASTSREPPTAQSSRASTAGQRRAAGLLKSELSRELVNELSFPPRGSDGRK